ncbi:MAG: CoA-binding protein [Microscillaceae bacterium]|nr:CoA-binding protein [Microscillaceae bacterium]MDW8460899.1 CoA-binding protein [Cytophagales bacterium]
MSIAEKKTLIIGATPNPERYAYKAASMLYKQAIPFVNMGIKAGEVLGQPILQEKTPLSDIHTVTLYISPNKQMEWREYIASLKPKRVIFNPGTENPEIRQYFESQGIQTIEACTLVMLSTGQF